MMDILADASTAALEVAFWDARSNGDVPAATALWDLILERDKYRARLMLIDMILNAPSNIPAHTQEGNASWQK